MALRTAVAYLLSTIVFLAVSPNLAAAKEPLSVEMDQAKVIELEKPAGTVIVGNPAIVDVQVLSSNRLVLTGKSSGITNVVILGEDGEAFVDEQVSVQTFEDNTVRVYRQASRSTYACTPKCVPTVTVGDDMNSFGAVVQQQTQRQNIVEQAAKGN
ncbi:pilus assembly protein N-terminal domain-containing protein [Jiella avicenniae]|uniref:Pilus assembly protein N-terminal domain-containing protein n=1 Tax=Jiella avicenniae TaxID=2907202 RepID=A0A9X1NW27_9HYPH|nr:pilus assembly protein N-terminal domain-containing protein [Jiella avicenniae]MCE7026567.1 pilus assembly protein N-terminal domain-containing protein [Jiella avicenniae]